jgi:hypothetical protein
LQCIIGVLIFAISTTSAFADGPSAWLRLDYTDIKNYEDGERTNTTDNFSQNYYFQFDKSVNPLLSYKLYLRTLLRDTNTTGPEGNKTAAYQRSIEPALDITLRNPMYGLNVGYRRTELWSTAHLRNESRDTSEYFYSRFDLTPVDLPFLSLQFDKQKEYDHLPVRLQDTTRTKYSANSMYDFLYKGLELDYNLTLSRNETKDPVDKTVSKDITDTLNASYKINYKTSLWRDSVRFSAGYQGNYAWNRDELFVNRTGPVPFKRSPSLGMYGLGTNLEPEVDTLVSAVTLSDEIYDVPATTPSGTINIGSNGTEYQNIGIQLFSSEKPVDTLYIYVNRDVTSDTRLSSPANWTVSGSNFNLPDTWTDIPIQSVTISVYDTLNDIYRYEIRFSTPQNRLFFRAVTMDTATVSDVLVTEIEAYGTDVIPQSGKITDTSKFFTQGINFSATIRPISTLSVALNYFLNRADQNPVSLFNSIAGAFTNIFSKSLKDEDENLRTNVTRSYGATATWLTHRLLTTTARFQRSEAFDNLDQFEDSEKTDYRSDTYSLGFSSSPVSTLDTNLQLIRTYSYSFDEKQSMNDLYLLTIGAKLYTDLNMIADIGYTKTKRYASDLEFSPGLTEDTESSTKYIRGTINARLSPQIYTNISYGFNRTSGDSSSTSNDGTLVVTYRPGQFINFSGNFKITDSDGDVSTSEGISADWLFVPAVRINVYYQHENREPSSVTSDMVSGYVMWYITKFLNVQFTSGYTRTVEEQKTETYNFGANLTCRFW